MFQKVCSLHLPAMVCYKWIQMEFEIVWACFRLGKLVWGPGGLLEVINAICTWTAQRTKHKGRRLLDSAGWADSCSGCFHSDGTLFHQREVTWSDRVTLSDLFFLVSKMVASWAFSVLPTGQRRHKHKRCVWNGRRRCCSDGWVVFWALGIILEVLATSISLKPYAK